MKFWDASALIPLLAAESASAGAQALFRGDQTVLVAWTTPGECASAIARAEHDQILSAGQADEAFARLDALAHVWQEVEPTEDQR